MKTMIDKNDRSWEVITLVLLLANVLLIAVTIPSLADFVPLHFNMAGEADGWQSKYMLWLAPGLAFAVYAFMTYASRQRNWYTLRHSSRNAEERRLLGYKMIRALKVSVLFFFTVLSYNLTQAAQGKSGGEVLYMVMLLFVLVLPPVIYYSIKISKLK